MNLEHWQVVPNWGTQCLEHDGYFIAIDDLLKRPVFWTDHISEKVWGTAPVVQELAAFAAGASAANRTATPSFSRRRVLALDAWARHRVVCGGPEEMPALFFAGFSLGVSERASGSAPLEPGLQVAP